MCVCVVRFWRKLNGNYREGLFAVTADNMLSLRVRVLTQWTLKEKVQELRTLRYSVLWKFTPFYLALSHTPCIY